MKSDDQNDLIIQIDMNVKQLLAIQADHEGRIRTLERLRNWTAGLAAAAAAAWSLISSTPHN